jgi:hypothetical protein
LNIITVETWRLHNFAPFVRVFCRSIPVEEEKPPQEQGHYLHPELFGAPAE